MVGSSSLKHLDSLRKGRDVTKLRDVQKCTALLYSHLFVNLLYTVVDHGFFPHTCLSISVVEMQILAAMILLEKFNSRNPSVSSPH